MGEAVDPGLRWWRLRVPLRRPWQGVVEREVLIVHGPAGWGEASPLPGFSCDPRMASRSAIEAATQSVNKLTIGQPTELMIGPANFRP